MAGRKSDFTLPTNTLDDLFSTQEERDDAKLAKIRDIPLTEIDNFPDHPFKVRDDEDMLQLVESVKERGVITPATVRQNESRQKHRGGAAGELRLPDQDLPDDHSRCRESRRGFVQGKKHIRL